MPSLLQRVPRRLTMAIAAAMVCTLATPASARVVEGGDATGRTSQVQFTRSDGPSALAEPAPEPAPALVPVPTPPGVPTPPSLPKCDAGRRTVADRPGADWDRIVLDQRHGLPTDWEPSDLVDIPSLGDHTDGQVRDFVVDDLVAMHEAAMAAQAPFDVVSGHRSSDHQQWLYDEAEPADREAPAMVAPAGHSEHQLGTTVDVVAPSAIELSEAFATTPAGQWLARHAHEYGFVTSYPRGAEDLTCYGWEPWHLRYVGVDLAARVHESGLPLRAWLLTADLEDLPTPSHDKAAG